MIKIKSTSFVDKTIKKKKVQWKSIISTLLRFKGRPLPLNDAILRKSIVPIVENYFKLWD